MELRSSAFTAGGNIPSRHTCDGEDLSPPLSWDVPPANARSFALICDDPDAPGGDWVHWVPYNLPEAARSLEQGTPARGDLPNGARQGRNDFGRLGYGGPCPPRGPALRYFFRLYALDVVLTLAAGATKKQLLSAMQGHILAQAELMGRYQRG